MKKAVLSLGLLMSSINAFADCPMESYLKVFRENYSALSSATNFEGKVITNLDNNSGTLYLTYTYNMNETAVPQRFLAYITLNTQTCKEYGTNHGATDLTPLNVFNH